MKAFVSKLVEKFNNKVLMIFAIVLGSLALLSGIFAIALEPQTYCGQFINLLIASVLFFVLAILLHKDDKKKIFIVSLILVANFVLASFGEGISAFVFAGNTSGAATAGLAFIGLGALGLFAAAAIHVVMLLKDGCNKNLLHFICTLTFVISGFFCLLGGILFICEKQDGLAIVTFLFESFLFAGEAVMFGFGGKKLLSAE